MTTFQIGSAEAASLQLDVFAHEVIDETAVVVGYTFAGDADLNGTVNLFDFNRLASHFGQSNALWTNADSNYDGSVNLTDFNYVAGAFGAIATVATKPIVWMPLDDSDHDAVLDWVHKQVQVIHRSRHG